jgi:hypothetical protein
MNAYIKNMERYQINNLMLHPKFLEKENKLHPKLEEKK